MAFDFEGLVKPQTVSAKGDVADRLPSGLKPVTEEKKDNSLNIPDYFTNMGVGKSILTVGEAIMDTAKQTNAYKKYMYSDEEKLSEAKKISIETGIPENVLIANDDNLAKGREMFNFRRKQMALAPQGLNDFDIQQVYDAYPSLAKFNDDTEMAIGFSHIENIKQTSGIIEAAKVGLETAKLSREYSAIGNKAVYGGTLTDEDWKRAQEIESKLKKANTFPDFGDNPLVNVIGNTAQQTYRYAPSVAKGAGAGLALGAIGAAAGSAGGVPGAVAGAKYGFGLGMKIGIAADMFDEVAGSRFMEYASLRDKQGNRLLNDADARLFTIVEAGAETGIEFWNYNSIMGMLGGSVHRKAIKDIVANAAGNNEAIRAGILQYAKGIAKVSGAVFAEELPEEAVQDVVEKGTWNVITGSYAPNNNYKQYSAKEMQDSALGAMADAAPSVAGFGIMAGAGSTVSSVRAFARMADIRKTYTEGEIQVANGVDMVAKLQDNKNENDLYKKQPDIYEKVLHNELDGTVYAQTRIDTELALADEETSKTFYQLAQDAGYEQEDINAIVENGADLVIPTEIYASKVDSGNKMNTFIKFGEGTESIARQAQMKEIYQKEMESFMDKEEGKQADLLDTLITANFPEKGAEQDLGAEIILSYPNDIATGWKAERNATQARIDNTLEPIYAKLREGMKQGVQTVEYGEDGQRIRASKNDQWYSDFYKEHKRPPTKAELQDIAIDIYKGNGAKYGFTDWEANTAELANAFKEHSDELQTELDRINLLDSIKPNLINLSHAELGVMKGLSKEAVKVYQEVSSLAYTATSDKARQSVKTSAILLARHADRIAEIARASGFKDFTAEDYVKNMRFDFGAQRTTTDGKTLNQLKDIVNTPEFKAWFGKSKLVDKNGKPMILYHGTPVGDLKEFKKGLIYLSPSKEIADIYQSPNASSISFGKQVTTPATLAVYTKMEHPFDTRKAKDRKIFTEEFLGKDGGYDENGDETEHSWVSNGTELSKRNLPDWTDAEDLYHFLKDKGYDYDGIIVDEGGMGGYGDDVKDRGISYIAFSSKQIKSVDNTGTFDANNPNIYYQSNNNNNLVAVHNLSVENLLHSAKMGGIAVPSVAITNIDHPLENFGEITLIGDADLINPASSKNKVFNADVYSPRYPEVITDVDSKKIDSYADEVKALADYKKIYEYRKPRLDDLEEDAKGGTRKLVYSTIARLMYASRNGLSVEADHRALSDFMEKHQDGFNAFLEDFLSDVSKGEKIFKGFTNLGNRKYIPHTLENVVKELTKTLQDGEGFNYGLGSLRAVVAKRYKTLKEIQKDRDKVISKKDFDKQKELLQKEYDEITTEAINKYTHKSDFNTIDNFTEILKEGIKRNNIEKELNDFGFVGMDVNRIRAFLSAIKSFPTEYFEAKIQRAVGVNEFAGAVIPKNSPQKVRDVLTENGVPFKEYEEGQRQSIVQSFSNELNEQKGKQVLFQQQNSINGSTTFMQNGERIIKLFETADQSTLVHELGHNFLADIMYWGKLETAPEWLKKDYATISSFLGYTGGELTTEQHEKFARGFEAYLRNGEAPVKGLRGVFRKFKKWMLGIYKDYTDLGGLPSAEVRAVFDRMLVSEQEVEDEAKLQQYESGLKEIGKIVSTSDAEMYARWQNEAKEEAKEKVLAVALKEINDSLPTKRAEEIAQYEKDIREELSTQDVFKVEAILKNNNDLTLLPALGYTEESYKEALAKAGGGLSQAVQSAVNEFTKEYDAEPMSKEAMRSQAEKAMRDGNYNDMLVGFELEAMRSKAESADVANDKAVKKIEEILADMEAQKDEEPAKVKALKQKVADLRYSYRWSKAEEKLIQENKLAELKKQIKDNKVQVRVLKSRVEKSVTWTKEIAQDRLSRLPLAEITTTKMWINLAKKSSQDALKAIKKEQWNDALKYKQQQLIYTVMATESAKIKDKVNKIIARQQKRSSLMIQGKTKMPVNERYYFNHLLYVFGINKRDALEPVDGAENFLAMVKRFADNYEANFTDEDGNIGLPNWLLSAIGSKEVYGSRTENPLYADVKSQKKPAMGYERLKLQDFLGIADLLSTIYTVGKNADKVRTVKTADGKAISLKDVVDDLITSITANVMIEANEDTTGATKKGKVEDALAKAGELNLELVKMETIFDQIDGGKENGPAMTYFYNIVNEARNHEKRMQIEATDKMKLLFKPYSTLELRKMRQDKKYKFGTSILTKEQVITLALNSGTALNKKRILDGYNVGELTLNETLSNLTEKDWTLIHGIWKLFNSYWEDTVGVEERMTGVGLNKQEALPFSITGKDGNVYKVSGGYYPIKYDPTKSVKAAEQQEDDIAKQMHNDNAIFGTRIGFTKERNKTAKIQRPVLLTFDVIPNALDQVIHNISHREMVRDINRIVTNKDFQQAVVDHFGIKTYRDMKQWVRDNWAQDKKLYPGDKIFAYLRRNITAAVLGWRTTTALLNVLNIFPMSDYLGAANAAMAVKDFYTNPMQNRAFVMGKSVFMADRVNTMDRDMREVNKNLEGKANPITRFAKNEGFRLIAETDLMLAMPLWLAEYKRVFQESVIKGQDVDTIERNAIAAGDKAVRRIFGSGEIHDLAPIQKSSELMKIVTMFYSYFNVAYNALSRRNRTGSRYDLARAFLYWMVLTSIGESLIRGAINGDDPEKLIKRIGKNLISQPLGMIPVARDVFVGTLDQIFDDKSYGGAKVSSVYDGFIRFDKARKTAVKFYDGDKDWIDLLQDSVKASNAFTGNSDTATDALFTTMRYIQTDFDAEIGEYFKALIFDKKLKK